MTKQVTNPHNHTSSHDSCVRPAIFKLMTPPQAANTKLVPHAQGLLIKNHPVECGNIFNELFHEQTEPDAKLCYPTGDHRKKLNEMQRRIYDKIITLRGKKQLNPTKTDAQRKKFLSKFNWNESLRNEDDKSQSGAFLVNHHSGIARHRLDIGINTDFNVELTPQHDKPVYSKSLPTPSNLRDDLLVDFALMHECGIITTPLFSKNPSPDFAQRKPNG